MKDPGETGNPFWKLIRFVLGNAKGFTLVGLAWGLMELILLGGREGKLKAGKVGIWGSWGVGKGGKEMLVGIWFPAT